MEFVVNVKSDTAINWLAGYPDRLMDRLLKISQRWAIKLQGHVKADKLTGQVLHNRTGTLRRSINQKVTRGPTEIKAIVGTNVSYARPHEFGFQGVVSVREHVRMQRMAWGLPMKDPHQVTVRAHPMKMNIPEKSFLRSALADYRDEIVQEMTKAAVEAKRL